MSKVKKLTIYVTTYERPLLLAKCLNSILSQDFHDYNLIILDNNSKKNYKKILTKYRNKKIKYIKHKKNLDSMGNVLYALKKKTNSEYIMIFHDDDLMQKSYIKTAINYLEKNKKISWIGSRGKSFSTFINFHNYNKDISINQMDLKVFANKLIVNNIDFVFSSVIYKKSDLSKLNFEKLLSMYNRHFDYPILFQLLKKKKCALINNKMIGYRRHTIQDSKTSFLNEKYLFNLFLIYKNLVPKDILFKLRYTFFYGSYNLINSYFSMQKNKRSNLKLFLNKALKLKLINSFFIFFYFSGFINFLLRRTLFKLRK